MSAGGTVRRGPSSRTVSAGLAISGAIVVTIATSLPWYLWGQGGPRRSPFSPNLYGLGSLPGPRWNSIAPVFVDVGAALLLLSGLLFIIGHGRYSRSAPAALCIGVLVVIVSSLKVQSPRVFNHLFLSLIQSVSVPRGPGLYVGLAGAALGLAALVPRVAGPVGHLIHNADRSTGIARTVHSR